MSDRQFRLPGWERDVEYIRDPGIIPPTGYYLRATCPEHGQMEPLTEGKVIADECSAIFRCPVCRVDYQVHVFMKPVVPQVTARCGTPAGAMRHRRSGQELCEPCREAWNEYARRGRDLVAT